MISRVISSTTVRRLWVGEAVKLAATSSRSYHSYPDPNEKPQISTHISDKKKLGTKPNDAIKLNDTFRIDAAFPGAPVYKGIDKQTAPTVKTTKLNNGLTVATQERPGSLMATIGLIVKCGSSYEQQTGEGSNLGAAHFLEMNAFRSNARREHGEVVKALEKIGAVSQCIALRDNIFYLVDVLQENIEEAVTILADTVLIPTFPNHELDESRDIVRFQAMELPCEVFSRDLVQRAAYRGFPLGNEHYCPPGRAANVTCETLQDFRAKHFYGSNIILTSVGVEHDSFMKLATEKFQALPSQPSSPPFVRADSQYVGGLLVEERPLKDPNFVKIAVAFEVGGWNSKELVPLCVLQQLLGGGSSFSAGGPGKGMYTRLYTQVLNQHHWIEAVEAFSAVNEQRGLLGIDTSCPVDYLGNAIRMVVEQFHSLSKTPVTNEELNRAKNMLKSMMMMNLESRLMQCEDIARQMSTYGVRKSPESLCLEIDQVSADDLKRVASLMFTRPPSVSVVGEGLKGQVPTFEDIFRFVNSYRNANR